MNRTHASHIFKAKQMLLDICKAKQMLLDICKAKQMLLAALFVAHGVCTAQSDLHWQLLKRVERVNGRITEVWVKDDRYKELHSEMKSTWSGTPDLETFMKDEQWVTMMSSVDPYFPGIFKARGLASMDLKIGDIVEMINPKTPRTVSAYEDLGKITKVLCRAAATDYDRCSKENALGWFGKDGKRLELVVDRL